MFYNPKKLGYFKVGDFKTFQKHRAIQQSRITGEFPEWDFNNETFSKHDWTSCPAISLEDLYIRRAEQLRNKYDYLVLFYSGGSDSQNILDICLKHNIHLDEIVCCHSLEGDGSTEAYFNAEVFNVAIPYLELIKNKMPNTKITLVDQTQSILNDFNGSGWFWFHNTALTPNCVMRSKIREWHPHFKELVNSGLKVGFIWGKEKPVIERDENGKYYSIFIDTGFDNNTSPYSQLRANDGWYDEFFYQDPEHVDIMIRQCHEIVNRIEEDSIPEYHLVTPGIVQPSAQSGKTKSGRILSVNGTACILYPYWNERTFSNGKNPSMVYGARDRWFFQKYTNSIAYKNWKEGIDYLQTFLKGTQDEFNWLNTDDIFDNVKGHITKRYYIT